MDILENILAALSVFLIGLGIISLAAIWIAPKLIETRFFRWLLDGRHQPNRANRVLMALWAILQGSNFLLFIAEYRLASFIVVAASVPLAIIVLKRRSQARAEV